MACFGPEFGKKAADLPLVRVFLNLIPNVLDNENHWRHTEKKGYLGNSWGIHRLKVRVRDRFIAGVFPVCKWTILISSMKSLIRK